MELRSGVKQNVPLIAGIRMQWITRKRKCDPCPAIDKSRFALPHQGLS